VSLPKAHIVQKSNCVSTVRPLCIVALVIAFATVAYAQGSRTSARTPKRGVEPDHLTAEEVARKYLSSVVMITCDDANGHSVLASGFFIAQDLIVTNYHVIEGMVRGEVKLSESSRREFTILPINAILDFDRSSDLALLSVNLNRASQSYPEPVGVSPEVAEMAEITKRRDPKNSATTRGNANASDDPLGIKKFLKDKPVLSLVPSSAFIEVGETVYALGNPQGLEGTISVGIVSGVRESGGLRLLQITSPISSGSSGGPLVDTKGRVVGVVAATLREGQNLNFAIPSAHVRRLIPRFLGDAYRFPSNAAGAWRIPNGLPSP